MRRLRGPDRGLRVRPMNSCKLQRRLLTSFHLHAAHEGKDAPNAQSSDCCPCGETRVRIDATRLSFPDGPSQSPSPRKRFALFRPLGWGISPDTEVRPGRPTLGIEVSGRRASSIGRSTWVAPGAQRAPRVLPGMVLAHAWRRLTHASPQGRGVGREGLRPGPCQPRPRVRCLQAQGSSAVADDSRVGCGSQPKEFEQ